MKLTMGGIQVTNVLMLMSWSCNTILNDDTERVSSQQHTTEFITVNRIRPSCSLADCRDDHILSSVCFERRRCGKQMYQKIALLFLLCNQQLKS